MPRCQSAPVTMALHMSTPVKARRRPSRVLTYWAEDGTYAARAVRCDRGHRLERLDGRAAGAAAAAAAAAKKSDPLPKPLSHCLRYMTTSEEL